MWLRLFHRKIVFETAALSARGGRAENEDAVGFRSKNDAGCWALADGLGGHRGGEVASRLAVEAALASFEENPAITQDAVQEHLARANRAVIERQTAEPKFAHMRTTLAMLVASPLAAMWAHAGDSRLYWFRDGKIREQTRDDSVPQRLADAGEISADRIRFHEDRSRLLNSLGAREAPAGWIGKMPGVPEGGDAFLLASDGFWEWVTESEMESDCVSAMSSEAWMERMKARVIKRASASYDNYSAIAVRVKE